MKFVLFASFFAVLSIGESALLGAKECTYGPSFWCGSIQNAKQCAAVGHCVQAVWEKSILPKDEGIICRICEDMINDARRELISRKTEREIQEFVARTCRLIPLKIISRGCISLSEEYVPEFVQLLASDISPQVICASIDLCNSIRVDKLLSKNMHLLPAEPQKIDDGGLVPKSQNEDCGNCNMFFEEAVATIKASPPEDTLHVLFSLCGRLGSFSDSCRAIVETHFADVYRLITTLKPDDICPLVGVCTEGVKPQSLTKTGDEPCDFCVAIIKHWREIVTTNVTKEEFKQMLDHLCDAVDLFKSECRILVDQYYEIIYNAIATAINPKEICEAVGLCGRGSVFNSEVPIWTLLDLERPNGLPHHIVGNDEANAIHYENQMNHPHVKLSKSDIVVTSHGQSGYLKEEYLTGNKVGNKDVCMMCEFVLHFLQNLLQDKPTREKVIEELDRVCTYFPHSIAEDCQDYVDAYGDQIIEFLSSEMDPSTICPMIHLCPGVAGGKSTIKTVKDDSVCIMCEFAMTQLEDMIKDNKTEEAIKSALESVCSIMPHSVRSECVDFVDQYTDQIIHLLINDFTPDQICQQLGLCKRIKALPKASKAQLPISRLFMPPLMTAGTLRPSNLELEQTGACVLCEFIVKELDKMLISKYTEDAVLKALDAVCNVLPSTLRKDCLGFVEEYAKPIMELLVSGLAPETVCRELSLCKDSFLEAMPKAVVTHSSGMCQVCQDALGAAKLAKAVSVKDFLKKVCPTVKAGPQMCVDLMTKYGEGLLILFDDFSPNEACQLANVCPSVNVLEERLLGGSKCTYGPSYWCNSQLHAAACRATQHCKDNVWGNAIPAL